MGYTTKFTGAVKLGRKLTMAEAKELLEVDSDKTKIDAYFQWVPAETFEHIVWDGEEKFYSYVEQLQWLCSDWLDQRGITANGILHWQGEETGDTGTITVVDNRVIAQSDGKSSAKDPKPLSLRTLQRMALEQVTGA
jgi:hypothetical protein